MANAKSPAQNPAPAQAAIATTAVVDKLACANESAQTADAFAREAAGLAFAADFLQETDKAKRLAAILDLYRSNLTHKAVKESFSAAIAVLIDNNEVVIAATAKTEKADGKLTFTAPQAMVKGEVTPPDAVITKLAPTEALAKLTTGVLKQVATAARENLGVARAAGGGRKAAPATEKRAPFFDELAAVLKDDALRLQAFRLIELAGWKVTRAK